MAVRWQLEKDEFRRGAGTYMIDPHAIQAEPGENGRHEEPDIEWMIQDIRKRGQETPVTVRSDGGKPVLVFGYQRLRAIKAINERYPGERREILCIFKELTKEEAFRANIAENRMRSEVTPIDDAHNIKRLMNVYNYTADQVIYAYFPSIPEGKRGGKEWYDAQRWVRERMALIGLAPAAEQAVRDGRVKLHGAIQLNKLSEAEQEKLVAGDGPVKIRDVKKAANTPEPTPRNKKGQRIIPGSVDEFGYKSPDYVLDEPRKLEGTGIDPDWDRDEAEDAEQSSGPLSNVEPESVRNLAEAMLSEIAQVFWHPDRSKSIKPELLALADAVLGAAAQASATHDFPQDTLDAMEAYRKARVAK